MDKTLNWLFSFQNYVDMEEFQEIFGEFMGRSLWYGFRESKHNLLSLWNILDKENQEILSNYMMKIKVSKK